MSVVFTFGSLGDILALVQLAYDLRAALDDASGAPAEIRTLVQDIDAFVVAMQDIQRAIERRRKVMRPDVINGIGAALARCRDALQKIQEKLARAQTQISSTTWRKYWGAAAWSILGGKKDLKDLRRRLVEQVNLIQTYLALSEANDQDMILHHMELQSATIERIYGVFQDFQPRFDVGVPFHFFDRDSAEYYKPLARTSLQRFRDFWQAYTGRDIATDIQHRWKLPWEELLERVQSKKCMEFISSEPLGFSIPTFIESSIRCMFFKEAAFGQWQVLVDTGRRVSDEDILIKLLLERRHGIGDVCDCEIGHCGVLHRRFTQQEQRINDAIVIYGEAATWLVKLLCDMWPDEDTDELRDRLYKIIRYLPDPDLLRSEWIPKVKSAAYEPGAMIDLFCDTPRRTRDNIPIVWKIDRNLRCRFRKAGNAATILCSLIVGEETPFKIEGVGVCIEGESW